MKKQLLRVALVFLVLSTVVAGAITVSADNHRQLKNRVLQRGDLPQDSQYYAEGLTQDHFPGVLSPVNIPLESEGFQNGYEVNAWYPLILQDAISEIKQSNAFVLNVVYQYQDEAQAAAALKQQLEWFHKDNITMSALVEQVDYDKSLDVAYGIKGNAFQLTYSQEGLTLVNYWFLGVKENTVILLMVDGLPDLATREVFNSLMPTVMQH
jgi:hypothetical protein